MGILLLRRENINVMGYFGCYGNYTIIIIIFLNNILNWLLNLSNTLASWRVIAASPELST